MKFSYDYMILDFGLFVKVFRGGKVNIGRDLSDMRRSLGKGASRKVDLRSNPDSETERSAPGEAGR